MILKQIDSRGTITIPIEMREGIGHLVSVEQREDGVIELRPHVAVETSQAWFWTPTWQEKERQADDAIAQGRVKVPGNTETMIRELAALRAEPASADRQALDPGQEIERA